MSPASFLRLAARNALRKKTRTALTAGMVVVGTALLVATRAWIDGVLGGALTEATALAGEVRIVAPEFAAREELAPLDANLPDVQPLLDAVRARPLVRAAYPRIQTGVALSAGDELGEVFGLAVGAPVEYFTKLTKAADKLVEGRWFEEGKDEIVIGSTLARELKVGVGAEIILVGQTQDGSISPIKGQVVGIVQAGIGALDQAAFVPFPKMQWMLDLEGGALELLVFGPERDRAAEVAADLRALPQLSDLSVLPWTERQPWAGMLGVVGTVRAMLIGVLVLLVALGVWNTMMMSVLERTSEIGVLRAMGLGRLQALGLFVGEAVTIAVLGGLLGISLGSWGGWALETYGVSLGEKISESFSSQVPLSSTIYGDLTARGVGEAFLLGLAMAFLGSLLPAIRAAFIDPVAAMRVGR